MSEQPQHIKSEIKEGFEIFNLKKILATTWTFLKRPKFLVDAVEGGRTEFVRPIRYLLSIGAPVLLLSNLLSIRDTETLMDLFSSFEIVDPAIRFVIERVESDLTSISQRIGTENSPLLYFVIAPIFAFFFKTFHEGKTHRFSYFISIAFYILGIYFLADLLSVIVKGIGLSSAQFMVTAESWFLFFLTAYVLFDIYSGSVISRVFRAVIATSVNWIVTGILVWIVIGIFFFYELRTARWYPSVGMGEYGVDVDKSLVQEYQLKNNRGVLVLGTELSSPAERVGLEEGDLITGINSSRITNRRAMRIAMDSVRAGDTVQVRVDRRGQELHLSIPAMEYKSVHPPGRVTAGFEGVFERNSVNILGFRSSMEVSRFKDGSPAKAAGMKINDRVVQIDDDTLKSFRVWRDAYARSKSKRPGDTTRFVILGDNKLSQIFVIMKEEKE